MKATSLFITMASKASEIQDFWKQKVGDMYHFKNKVNLVEKNGQLISDSYAFLPTIDQMLEMSDDKENIIIKLAVEINSGVYRGKEFSSYSELFLAFTMRSLYGKQWSKNKWVLIKS